MTMWCSRTGMWPVCAHHGLIARGMPPALQSQIGEPLIRLAAGYALSPWQGHSGGAEASFDGGDEFLRNRIQLRGSRPVTTGAHGPRGHVDRLVCDGVAAAEQSGIGDVLDMVHR